MGRGQKKKARVFAVWEGSDIVATPSRPSCSGVRGIGGGETGGGWAGRTVYVPGGGGWAGLRVRSEGWPRRRVPGPGER